MDLAHYEQRLQTVCLLILSSAAVAGVLYWLRPVLVPFVLAVFIVYGLLPLVEFQVSRLRLPRPLAVGSTLVVGIVLLGGLGMLVSTSVAQLQANSHAYQAYIETLAARLSSILPAASLPAEGNPLAGANVGGVLLSTANAVVGLVSQGVLVLVIVVYLLLGGVRRPGHPADTWAEIETGIEHYVVTKAAISLATGALVGASLALLRVEFALVFGVLAFLLNFIPGVGSVIATLLPLPVVVVSPDISPLSAVLAIAVPGVIQFAIGNVVEPRLMGEALDLHPLVILLTLIVWGMLWGVVGMLLATPMTATLKILFEKLEPMRPVAHVLAGRLDLIRERSAPRV